MEEQEVTEQTAYNDEEYTPPPLWYTLGMLERLFQNLLFCIVLGE